MVSCGVLSRLTRLKISDGSKSARDLEGRVISYHKCRTAAPRAVRCIAWLGVAVIGVEGVETPSGIVKRALQLSL